MRVGGTIYFDDLRTYSTGVDRRITLVGSLRFISKLMVLLWDPMARWLMSV